MTHYLVRLVSHHTVSYSTYKITQLYDGGITNNQLNPMPPHNCKTV